MLSPRQPLFAATTAPSASRQPIHPAIQAPESLTVVSR